MEKTLEQIRKSMKSNKQMDVQKPMKKLLTIVKTSTAGITLMTLVIEIIILLILAGITIGALTRR